MDVMVTTEHRFYGGPDGAVWTAGQFPYSYFTRYLDVFDHVFVVARVGTVDRVPDSWKPAEGPGVSVLPVPYYLGPLQFAVRLYAIRQAVQRSVGRTAAAIFRAPSILAILAERAMSKERRPYGLEIVGDPAVVFSRGVVDHPLRPLLRLYAIHQLKRQCRTACAAAYLTREALQRHYPPGPDVFHTSYPEAELRDEAFAPDHIRRHYRQRPLTLIGIGSMAQLYKGFDVLLRALKQCLQARSDLRVELVGEGKYRSELEALGVRLEVQDRVEFLGQLPSGQAVRDRLDQAHVFVMPSRVEGMPSAMIEAMARGLPCIGSAVGGIPELLPPEDLVPPGDADALALKIREIVADPARMARMAAGNLEKAWQFHEDELRKRRLAFYRHVKEQTEAWQKGRRP
jgi:glycosyltransferase involved in cell wall biosynthesis